MSVYYYWALGLILAIFGMWKFFPHVIQLIRPGWLIVYFEDNDTPVFSKYELSDVEQISQDLTELGFEKLGTKVQKLPLWSESIKEIVFASKKEQAFATIFHFRKKVRYSFFTPFTTGQSVLTAHDAFRDYKTDQMILENYVKDEPEKMLQHHRKNIESFSSQGLTAISDFSRESRVALTKNFYQTPEAIKSTRIVSAIFLVLLLACFIPLVWLIIASF